MKDLKRMKLMKTLTWRPPSAARRCAEDAAGTFMPFMAFTYFMMNARRAFDRGSMSQ